MVVDVGQPRSQWTSPYAHPAVGARLRLSRRSSANSRRNIGIALFWLTMRASNSRSGSSSRKSRSRWYRAYSLVNRSIARWSPATVLHSSLACLASMVSQIPFPSANSNSAAGRVSSPDRTQRGSGRRCPGWGRPPVVPAPSGSQADPVRSATRLRSLCSISH